MDNYSEPRIEHVVHKVARLPALVHEDICRRDARLVQGDVQSEPHPFGAHAGPSVTQADVLVVTVAVRSVAHMFVEVSLVGVYQADSALQAAARCEKALVGLVAKLQLDNHSRVKKKF